MTKKGAMMTIGISVAGTVLGALALWLPDHAVETLDSHNDQRYTIIEEHKELEEKHDKLVMTLQEQGYRHEIRAIDREIGSLKREKAKESHQGVKLEIQNQIDRLKSNREEIKGLLERVQ